MDIQLLTENDLSIEAPIYDDEGEEIGSMKFGATTRSDLIIYIAKETREGLMIRRANI